MTDKTFWLGLLATTAVATLAVTGLHSIPRLSPDWPLSVIFVALFFVLSILIYFFGRRTANATNKLAFNNLITGVTLIKMFLSCGIIAAYAIIAEPTDKIFVLPFFLIYILFTGFEIFVLIKLARETPARISAKDRLVVTAKEKAGERSNEGDKNAE